VRILRSIAWVLAALGFLIFAIYNWQPVELTLWQNLVLETKVPMLALIAFAAGFLPMWAYHRSIAWGLNRRIRTLENSLKQAAFARANEAAAAQAAAVDSPGENGGNSGGQGPGSLAPVPPGSEGEGA